MATGHGVQQIPEASAVLLSPQQQEQPTLPPIEHRHVAEHQSAATVSFARVEPTENDRAELVAAIAEAPATDEPMEIEGGASCRGNSRCGYYYQFFAQSAGRDSKTLKR